MLIAGSRSTNCTWKRFDLEFGESISPIGFCGKIGAAPPPSTGEFFSIEFGESLSFLESVRYRVRDVV